MKSLITSNPIEEIPFNEEAARNAKLRAEVPMISPVLESAYVAQLKSEVEWLRKKLVEAEGEEFIQSLSDSSVVFHVVKDCQDCPHWDNARRYDFKTCYYGNDKNTTNLIIALRDVIWCEECRKRLIIKKEKLTKEVLDENGTLRPNYFMSADVAARYIDWMKALEMEKRQNENHQ